jgi:hypothetical protein
LRIHICPAVQQQGRHATIIDPKSGHMGQPRIARFMMAPMNSLRMHGKDTAYFFNLIMPAVHCEGVLLLCVGGRLLGRHKKHSWMLIRYKFEGFIIP